MQAFWYRLLVDINRDELRASVARTAVSSEAADVQSRADRSMDAAPSSAEK
jgi:N-formylglutamate amidohydrolase